MASAGRCFPSGVRGEPIAGDFFDVFALDETRTLIAVGDVVGHGRSAAARMEGLRAENRALALRGLAVTEVLHLLDLLQCHRGPEELATLWLGIYDKTTDWLDYASAGHPPPILAEADGVARLLSEASAPPLGTGQVSPHVLVERVQLSAGALLVTYSDGLIERAGLDLEHQMETLRRIVEQVYEPSMSQDALENLVEGILERLPHSPVDAPDDVCILAVHLPQAGTADIRHVTQRSA
jgi:serine phosphatase RsbU (regulator of sigma subunit)